VIDDQPGSGRMGLIQPLEKIPSAQVTDQVWAGPDFRERQRMQHPVNLIEPTGSRITKNPAQVPFSRGVDFRLTIHPQSNPHLIEPLPVA